MTTPKKQAAQDLAKKMKLEEPFQRELKKLFNTIGRDMEAQYAVTGSLIDVETYDIELESILRNNYRKISKAFKHNLRNQEKQLSDKEVALLIDTQLTTFINAQTSYQSDLIITSLSKEISASVDTIIIDAAAEGISLTKDEIAVAARRKFKKKIAGRTSRIAVTETQIISEKAKFIEAFNLKEHKGLKVLKEWVSTLDEATRVSHVFADGQIIPVNEPFIVGEEQLMVPGDTSLGASADNIIECRCNAIYRKE